MRCDQYRQLALGFFPGLITGRLFDLGYLKIPHFFASCFLILCTFLVAECKTYWQFFLVQGLGVGVSFASCDSLTYACLFPLLSNSLQVVYCLDRP